MRQYVRKTNRGKWTSEDLLKAIRAINCGLSYQAAATLSNVPKSTIRDHITKKCTNTLPKLGRHAVFSPEQEENLATHVRSLSNMFDGVSFQELRVLAFDYAEKLGINHPFSKTNRKAGKDWSLSFRQRHNIPLLKRDRSSNCEKHIDVSQQFDQVFCRVTSLPNDENEFHTIEVVPFDSNVYPDEFVAAKNIKSQTTHLDNVDKASYKKLRKRRYQMSNEKNVHDSSTDTEEKRCKTIDTSLDEDEEDEGIVKSENEETFYIIYDED